MGDFLFKQRRTPLARVALGALAINTFILPAGSALADHSVNERSPVLAKFTQSQPNDDATNRTHVQNFAKRQAKYNLTTHLRVGGTQYDYSSGVLYLKPGSDPAGRAHRVAQFAEGLALGWRTGSFGSDPELAGAQTKASDLVKAVVNSHRANGAPDTVDWGHEGNLYAPSSSGGGDIEGRRQRSWQTSLATATAAEAAWYLWDTLDATTKQRVRNMTRSEMMFLVDYPHIDRFDGVVNPGGDNTPDGDISLPDGGVNLGGIDEEGWRARLAAISFVIDPDYAQAHRWERRAVWGAADSTARVSDVRSTTRINRMPMQNSLGGANVNLDYGAPNHVNPDPNYMRLFHQVAGATSFELAEVPVTEGLFHNHLAIWQKLRSFYLKGTQVAGAGVGGTCNDPNNPYDNYESCVKWTAGPWNEYDDKVTYDPSSIRQPGAYQSLTNAIQRRALTPTGSTEFNVTKQWEDHFREATRERFVPVSAFTDTSPGRYSDCGRNSCNADGDADASQKFAHAVLAGNLGVRSKYGTANNIVGIPRGLTGLPLFPAMGPDYTDVGTGEARDATGFTGFHGILGVSSGGTFNPTGTVPRINSIVMLWKAEGSPSISTAHPFTDGPRDGLEGDLALRWAAREGVATGTTFNPSGTLTRGDIAIFMYRERGAPQESPDAGFTDTGLNNSELDKAADWYKDLAISAGTSPTTYGPGNAVNRQTLAIFLWRRYVTG